MINEAKLQKSEILRLQHSEYNAKTFHSDSFF